MRRLRDGEQKPLGWSWFVSLDPNPLFWFYGGKLHIPAGTADLDENDFEEWFFRIPFSDCVVTLCRIGPPVRYRV